MKKILFFALVFSSSIFTLSSCKSGKGCGGGGWYGKRNLEVTVEVCPLSSEKSLKNKIAVAP